MMVDRSRSFKAGSRYFLRLRAHIDGLNGARLGIPSHSNGRCPPSQQRGQNPPSVLLASIVPARRFSPDSPAGGLLLFVVMNHKTKRETRKVTDGQGKGRASRI